MKLNQNDVAILKVLFQDGRESFRKIAKRTSLTTPTVSYHFSRMMKSGLIKKFVPVLDQTMGGQGVNALVKLRTRAGNTNSISKKLSALPEVSGVFITTGENNLTLKVSCADSRQLQDLLNVRLPRMVDGELVSSELIVKTVKDEQPVFLTGDINVELKCDFCKEAITRARPYNIRVGTTYHYFCCKTCRRSYLERYGQRIGRINAASKTA